LINNLYSSYGNAKSQFEIQQLQQEVEKAKQRGAELDNQIKQVQEIINQQNQILSQQKSNQSEDTEMIDYCNSLKRDLPEGVLEGVAKLCAKYGVTLKVEALFDTQKVVEKTPTKKVQRPVFLDEQTETKMPNILDEKPATISSTTTMHTESVVQKSFLRKTFEKIKSFFVLW
jgi:hypothetical protein